MDIQPLIRLSLPLLILSAAGIVTLLGAAFGRRLSLWWLVAVSGVATVVAAFFCWQEWVGGFPFSLHLLVFDRLAWSFDLLFLIGLGLTLLLSKDDLHEEGTPVPECYPLLLFATVGLLLIAHGGDLIVLFLGIEITSLSSVILAGLRRGVIRSLEASLKYLILGAFASGFLLYGIALAYGATGSTSLASLQQLSQEGDPILIVSAVALLLIGVGFKIAAVPFHFWSPDVYEGAPTSVTAFMASAVKAGGFAVLIRLVLALGHLPQIPWVPVLGTLSVLTMTLGNLVAIQQTNLKRMLAYSSIAHAGYALVGVTAALAGQSLNETTLGAVLFYLFAYSLMTIGAFAVVIAIGQRGEVAEEVSDYSGLAEKHPYLAAAMVIFLLSLTGIPPTIGFVGKFYLFSGALQAGLYGLVIVAVLNSALSVYYYLAPVVSIYFRNPREIHLPPLSYALLIGIFLCLFSVLYFGLFPSEIYLIARESVRELIF